MERRWTEDSIRAWKRRRDEHRMRQGMDPIEQLRTSTSPQTQARYGNELENERRELLAALEKHSTETAAWVIHKFPSSEFPAPFSGTLFLPHTFAEQHGSAQIQFSDNDDLNRLVYEYYNHPAGDTQPGVNFVEQDGLCARRHEYLGPSPFVTGFQCFANTREAHIEWWDSFARKKWVGKDTWKNEVYFDRNVEGWVSRPRSDVDYSFDRDNYPPTQA